MGSDEQVISIARGLLYSWLHVSHMRPGTPRRHPCDCNLCSRTREFIERTKAENVR